MSWPGSAVRPASPAKMENRSSSRRTSKSRNPGRCWPPTWSPPNTFAARREPPSGRAASEGWWPAWWTRSPGGARRAGISPLTTTAIPSTRSFPICCCGRRPPSTPRSGSTSAWNLIHSVPPASSTRWKTRWTPFSAWPRPRGCSSSSDREPAAIFRRSGPLASTWPAGGLPPARSRS